MTQSCSIEQEGTAYHEAGHAIMGAVRGTYPTYVTIVRKGNIAGKAVFADNWPAEFDRRFSDFPEKRERVETLVLIKLAAAIAHDIRFPDRVHDESDECDEKEARNFITDCAGWADASRESYYLGLKQIASKTIQEHWAWVEAVAAALMKKKTILSADIRALSPAI